MSGVYGLDGALDWSQAFHIARTCASPLPTTKARLDEAAGSVLAEPITRQLPDPAEDVAAMRGFAVRGEGPWRIEAEGVEVLEPGTAVLIAEAEAVPRHADSVLPAAEAAVSGTQSLMALDLVSGMPDERARPPFGANIVRTGSRGGAGDLLVPAGGPITAPVLSVAAAAGLDHVDVVRPPVVGILVVGSTLLNAGPPRRGRVRDALGTAVQAFVGACGARANPPVRASDSAKLLLREIDDAQADVIITTGSTEPAQGNHVREVLRELDARWLIDGVRVQPGAQMLLARLPDERLFVGLPGWPQSAMAALVTLVAPLIAALRGAPDTDPDQHAVLGAPIAPPDIPDDSMLAPVGLAVDGIDYIAHPLPAEGPAGLQGWARAQAVAVVPPGFAAAGRRVHVLPIPGATWPRLRPRAWDDAGA